MIKFYILITLLMPASTLFGQIISGIVLSKSEMKPLEGVNIGVVHKAVGTITNNAGHFSLKSSYISSSDSIRISMIGFKSQVFAIRNLQVNEIFKLEEEVNRLSGVEPGQ